MKSRASHAPTAPGVDRQDFEDIEACGDCPIRVALTVARLLLD